MKKSYCLPYPGQVMKTAVSHDRTGLVITKIQVSTKMKKLQYDVALPVQGDGKRRGPHG